MYDGNLQTFKFLQSIGNIPITKNDTNDIYSKVYMGLSETFLTKINELTT